MILQDAIDDLIKLVGVFCPMYDTAVFFGFSGKLVEIFVKMGDGVALDGAQKVASCHLAYVWFFKNSFAALLCDVLIILLFFNSSEPCG